SSAPPRTRSTHLSKSSFSGTPSTRWSSPCSRRRSSMSWRSLAWHHPPLRCGELADIARRGSAGLHPTIGPGGSRLRRVDGPKPDPVEPRTALSDFDQDPPGGHPPGPARSAFGSNENGPPHSL